MNKGYIQMLILRTSKRDARCRTIGILATTTPSNKRADHATIYRMLNQIYRTKNNRPHLLIC